MSNLEIADCILLSGALLGTVWVLTPTVMFALGLTRFRILVSDDPVAAEPTGDDSDYERRYRQFLSLGFRPIGTTIETCWFSNPIKWYRESSRPLRWLATADGQFLVSFHRLIPTEPVRYGIVTLLTEDGMVRTTCPGVGENKIVENRLRVELPNAEPAELFAKHQEHVRAFAQGRGLKLNRATLRDAAAMEEINTRQVLARVGPKSYSIPVSFFLVPAFLALSTALRFGWAPSDWHVWALSACVGTLVFAGFRHVAFPRLFRQAVERRRAMPK